MNQSKEIVVVYVEGGMLDGRREGIRSRMQKEFPGMQIAIVDSGMRVALLSSSAENVLVPLEPVEANND